ncbi:MAG TPA: hypothetical protein VK190_04725 [Pseudoneobacillus sp.]|nr:hypothetical protein [Pseudoneobacillus sp.]
MNKKLCLNGCGNKTWEWKPYCSIECEVEDCDKMNKEVSSKYKLKKEERLVLCTATSTLQPTK